MASGLNGLPILPAQSRAKKKGDQQVYKNEPEHVKEHSVEVIALDRRLRI